MYENFPTSRVRVLAAASAVQFLVSIDLSIVNVALPQIDAGLGFSTLGLTWVIHAYALTFGGLLLLGGRAADRLGPKRVLVTGLVVFALASFGGGLAQHPGQLVAARALQGVGAAAMAPAALAVLTQAFPHGRERVRAFGVWGAMNAAGGAVGVLLGGLLAEYADWRWVMFVNVPMALVTVVMVKRGVAEAAPPAPAGRPDIAGAALATAGIGLLVLGIVRSDQVGWTTPATVATGLAAVALLAGFVRVESRTTAEPLVRLGLLGMRGVTGSNLFNLLLGAAMASAFYFMSLYLQEVLGHGPARTGLEFLPFALGVVGGSGLAIRLGQRIAPRSLLVGGALLTAFGFGWLGQVDAQGTFMGDVLAPSLLASVGFGISLATVARTATAGVPSNEAGVASGLLNSSRQIGATLGLAALGASAAHHTGGHTDAAALADGYGWGLTLSAVLLVAAAAIARLILSHDLTHDATVITKGESLNTRQRHTGVLSFLYAGLALTLTMAIVPFLARGVIADHVRAGYPAYSAARVDSTVTLWLTILAVGGALGVAGWTVSIWAVRTQRRARLTTTALMVLGIGLALTLALTPDTSGEVGLAPLFGGLGILPCVAGALAVAQLWRHHRSPTPHVSKGG